MDLIASGNIPQELIALFLASFASALLKTIFKPSKTEVKIVIQLISGIIILLLKWSVKHDGSISQGLDNISNELTLLKSKLKRSKIKLG